MGRERIRSTTGKRGAWAVIVLRALLAAAAAAHLAAFIFVATARLAYPYELEWLEGGLADEVLVILRGQAAYAQPSLRLVAFIYPPVYFYVSAAAAALVGPGFLPLRLVSLAAALACFGLIYALVRQGGGGRAAGLVAAGLFAATFKLGGNWLVLARVDALFVALLLAGVYVLARARTGRAFALAGGLLALSFLTKQSALLVTAPLALYAVYADRRRGWLLAASFALVALAASAGFNWASQGWYGYYVFVAALHQPPAADNWLTTQQGSRLLVLAPALLAGLAFVASEWRARPAPSTPAAFWLALAAGAAGSSYWVLLRLGATENNLLPALAVVALLAGLALDRALKLAAARPAGQRAALLALIGAVYLWQFAQLAYNPLNHLPNNDNRAAAQALAQRVAGFSGEAWLPQHGSFTRQPDDRAAAHLAAIEDVFNAGGPPAGRLRDEVRAALRARRFAAIVVDGPDFTRDFPELEQNYAIAENLPLSEAFYSIEGARTLPEVVYVPRP
jgi:4-amino-4-deoxy-L-arabinose transferase-like glycosyltransferase